MLERIHQRNPTASSHKAKQKANNSRTTALYSKTPITRLPWVIGNHFPIAQENNYLVKISYFIKLLYVVCIHYKSPHPGDSNEYI